jgi:hypothetical protein
VQLLHNSKVIDSFIQTQVLALKEIERRIGGFWFE